MRALGRLTCRGTSRIAPMDYHDRRPNHLISDELHPIIYIAIVGLGLWFVLSAWVGFATDTYTAYLLVVVSGLVLVAVAIPCAIWLASRKGPGPDTTHRRNGFRDWASGDFSTSSGRLKASAAAVQILLPIAAVAFGMTAFAIVVHSIELGII
jgi:hypothetical protein